MIDFSSRLRELRASKSQRQKDLADVIGVAQTTIANYEQGARFPDEKILHRIADFFDVSLDYLLGRSDVSLLAHNLPYPNTLYSDEEALAPMSPLAREYLELILAGKREEAGELVHNSVKAGLDVRDIYSEVFERTLKEVGLMWKNNKVDAAMEHYYSATTQMIMSQLHPYIKPEARAKKQYTCLALSVCGEMHDVGVRMVADFLEMDGWKTFFLGSNLCNEDIVNTTLNRSVDLLALSATMFFSVESIARAIRAIRGSKKLHDLAIMVGGRPFNQDRELWKKVGGDGCADSAKQAVALANRLVAARAGRK